MKQRILVTGGAGFVGSHLVEALLKENHHVICVDNFSTGKRQHLSHLLAHPNFEILSHDICYPLYVEADAIYHLADTTHGDPIQATKTHVMGTLNILGLAKRLKASFLYTSSCLVYDPPLSEGEQNTHAEGKRCAETLVLNYQHLHGLDVKIARLFPLYGPRMNESAEHAIGYFITQALKHETIALPDHPTESLAPCYIADAVRGVQTLMDSSLTGPFNLGEPTPIPLADIAKKIVALADSRSSLAHHAFPSQPWVPDISSTQEKLQWTPHTSLDEGLRHTLAHYEKLFQITGSN